MNLLRKGQAMEVSKGDVQAQLNFTAQILGAAA